MKLLKSIVIILCTIIHTVSNAQSEYYYSGRGDLLDNGTLIEAPGTALLVKESDGTYTFRWAKDQNTVETPFDRMLLSEQDEFGKQTLSRDGYLIPPHSPVTYYKISLVSSESYIKEDSLYYKVHMGKFLTENPEEEIDFMDIIFRGQLLEVTPSTIFTWGREEAATGYRINVYNRNEFVCSLNYDTNGKYLGFMETRSISLKTTEEFSFDASTLDLENGTYYYTISALNGEEPVQIKEGVFKMDKETGTAIKTLPATMPNVIAYYNFAGQKLSEEPQKGMYIILYDNGTSEKIVKH